MGYEEDTWLYLRGQKENPCLGLNSRTFWNKPLTLSHCIFQDCQVWLDGLFTAQGCLTKEPEVG